MTSKEANVELSCPLCTTSGLKFTRINDYLRHQRLFHAHQANFRLICSIGGCKRWYTNIGTFQNHVYNVHCCKNDNSSFSQDTTPEDPQITVLLLVILLTIVTIMVISTMITVFLIVNLQEIHCIVLVTHCKIHQLYFCLD